MKNRDNPEFDEKAADGVHIHSRNVKTKLQEEFKKILGSKRRTRFFKFQYFFRKERNSLNYTPGFFNKLLGRLNKIENKMLLRGIKFPFGVGIICIAKK